MKSMTVPLYFEENALSLLTQVDQLPETLRAELQQAYETLLYRKRGAAALVKCSPALLEDLSLQVADRLLEVDALQDKHWAREIALWLEASPRLVLIEEAPGFDAGNPYTLFALPPEQAVSLSPSDDAFEGVALSSHPTLAAAEQRAEAYCLPIVDILPSAPLEMVA